MSIHSGEILEAIMIHSINRICSFGYTTYISIFPLYFFNILFRMGSIKSNLSEYLMATTPTLPWPWLPTFRVESADSSLLSHVAPKTLPSLLHPELIV